MLRKPRDPGSSDRVFSPLMCIKIKLFSLFLVSKRTARIKLAQLADVGVVRRGEEPNKTEKTHIMSTLKRREKLQLKNHSAEGILAYQNESFLASRAVPPTTSLFLLCSLSCTTYFIFLVHKFVCKTII